MRVSAICLSRNPAADRWRRSPAHPPAIFPFRPNPSTKFRPAMPTARLANIQTHVYVNFIGTIPPWPLSCQHLL